MKMSPSPLSAPAVRMVTGGGEAGPAWVLAWVPAWAAKGGSMVIAAADATGTMIVRQGRRRRGMVRWADRLCMVKLPPSAGQQGTRGRAAGGHRAGQRDGRLPKPIKKI